MRKATITIPEFESLRGADEVDDGWYILVDDDSDRYLGFIRNIPGKTMIFAVNKSGYSSMYDKRYDFRVLCPVSVDIHAYKEE